MKKYVVLYNPYSGKGNGLENAKKLEKILKDAEITYEDMIRITDQPKYIRELPEDTTLIFTGGDGTLNRVINAIYGMPLERDILYFPAGSGNDFINDLELAHDCAPFPINPYMQELPSVEVNGKCYRFINAVSIGLDGYTCEMQEILKSKGKKKSYKLIAFEGLMGKYRTCGGSVTVDGVSERFEKIWLAAAMFGRFYGGGVMMGPTQSRFNEEGLLTAVTIHDVGRLRTLFLFPSITKGKGEQYPEIVEYRKGREITVNFDRPTAVQIDGDVISDVTTITVRSGRQ